MDNNGKYISITEASRISGKHIATIYKGIRKGRILAKEVEAGANTVKKVLKQDIIRLFGIKVEAMANTGETQANTVEAHGEYHRNLLKSDIKAEMKEVIEEFFSAKQAELVKPMEEMALYRLGGMEKENLFLKEKLETVLNEYMELQNKIKVLPELQKEKEAFELKLLQEKEQIIKDLEASQKKEKENLLNKVEQQAKELEETRKQKEALEAKVKQEVEEKSRLLAHAEAEKAELEASLKIQSEEEKNMLKFEAEKREKQIAEAWKKELEEAKRPWWKIW